MEATAKAPGVAGRTCPHRSLVQLGQGRDAATPGWSLGPSAALAPAGAWRGGRDSTRRATPRGPTSRAIRRGDMNCLSGTVPVRAPMNSSAAWGVGGDGQEQVSLAAAGRV